MPQFKKKPVVVTAEQYNGPHGFNVFDPPSAPEGVMWTEPDPHSGFCWPYVVTAHGQETRVSPGDWIITEPDGRGHYPCKPDIFEATYEPA